MSNAEWQGQPVTTPATVPSSSTNEAANKAPRSQAAYQPDPPADVAMLVEAFGRAAIAYGVRLGQNWQPGIGKAKGAYLLTRDDLLAALRQRDEQRERVRESLKQADADTDTYLRLYKLAQQRITVLEAALRRTVAYLEFLARSNPFQMAGRALWGQDSAQAMQIVQEVREVLTPYWACGCPIQRDVAGIDVHQETCHDHD